ncbi:MAG: alpha/beta hydrolase [Nitrospirae bacterium]|nr:alpha/beta hydrolase [Nitrospirota bacterium]
MKILPDSMQFDQKKITHEYTEIPEDLKHNVKLSAFSNQPTVNSGPLFEITLPLYDLSNQQIIMTYEPETVEDQQIMDSYGGLDNTPAYLVRLRPVLKVNYQRAVVGKDGLAMGEDYKLIIELISPNGIERITNTHITGNLTAIGIVAQRALSSQDSAISAEDDAETILYKEANRYIDRWNEAEDELASLLHLNISRPIPTVVTVGGVIDVTYLLDMPHGFEWKGVFIDASLRAVSPITHNASPITADRQKTFMQLSGLQGSVLEHRIFENDFQVESISTAKLFQLSDQQSAFSGQLLTVDKTNITAVLSASDLDDNIKEDIINAVNQNYIVRIPSADGLLLNAISYKDWTGTGYTKENPSTGEAGYMLSGMIAGGMTAIKKEDWKKQDVKNALSRPSSIPANDNPDAVEKIVRFGSGNDYRSGIVGKQLKRQFEVIALDSKGIPVKGVSINFKVVSGGSKVQGENSKSEVVIAPASEVTVLTGPDGIARARLTLGTQTADSPYYRQETNAAGGKYWELEGLNLVSVSASTTKKRMTTDKPFEAYGKPGAAAQMVRLNPTTDIYGPPSVFASLLWVKIVDQYGNSISDKNVQYKIKREYLGTPPSSGAINAKLFGEMTDCPGVATIDCSKAKEADVTPFEKRTEYFGVHPYLIMGNTENTKYTITATAFKDVFDSQGRRIDNKTALNSAAFTFYTKAVENAYVSLYAPYAIDAKGNKIDAWKAGEIFPEPLSAAMFYTERTKEGILKIMPVVKDPPVDAPYKNDAKVEFFVVSDEGGVRPSNYQPVDTKTQLKFELSALQTVDDPINKGTYAANLKLGSTPGMNRINAIGTVTASVPSYDEQGNVTRTDRTLAASYPIELWGIKIAVDEPKYRQLVLNNNGYPVSDLEIKYSIDPLLYQYQKSEVSLVISEQLSDAYAGFVQADSNGRLVLSAGGAKFDREKSYYAEVVLNRGTRAEVRSEKIPLINAALIPDYDRNGIIDDADRERAMRGDKFYFWINDDDDGGETDGSDIPGDKMLTSFSLDHEDTQVDGIRDLIDFFPVYLDIKSVLKAFDPSKHKYVLKSEDASLNFVFTDIEAQHTGYYLTGDDNNLNIPVKLGSAVSYPISATGRELVDPYSITPFLEKITSSTAESSKGIILLEGKKESITPLELAVLDANQKIVFSMKLNLNMAGVEKMFRHKNLTSELYKDVAPGPDSKSGEEDRLSTPNCPDVECMGADPQKIKSFVYIHGYGNNGQEARGRQVEIFKRMFWSGSKAKFYGVTWYGWDSQVAGVTRNFHINVEHAFATAPHLKTFLNNEVTGEISLAAHSLGNMVVSSMLTDNLAEWNANKKIKNYFMLDAAVAAEAYGFADDGSEALANTHPDMTHPSWLGYKEKLWASEWHTLFDAPDNRKKLTWRNIFSQRPSTVTYYNYFSSGEDVLDVHTGYPQVLDIVTDGIGRYAWALQEKLKGATNSNNELGSNYGGWGFNLSDPEYTVDADGYVKQIAPVQANGIQNSQLMTRPFFKKGNDGILFDAVAGSNYAATHKYRLLADAIPARTLAAGKTIVVGLTQTDGINIDMQTTFKTRKTAGIYWPRLKGEWLHGDVREIAFSYVYLLFNDFVIRGGLR